MEAKPPLPVNPNGLIRSYLARQHTARVPTPGSPLHTHVSALAPAQPAAALPAASQPAMTPPATPPTPAAPYPMTIQMPAMPQLPATPALRAGAPAPMQISRTVPFVIRPAGKPASAPRNASVPAHALTAVPARSVTTPLPVPARKATQTTTTKPQHGTPPAASSVGLPTASSDSPLKQEDRPNEVPPLTPEQEAANATLARKRLFTRIALALVALIFAVALAVLWRISATQTMSPTVTQQQFSNTPQTNATGSTSTNVGTDATIQAYITGAVKHPGVYKLANGARVYELLQAAGGPLPNADLVALNLAAKLNDGQEVYVLTIGETPPASVRNATGPPATGGTNGTAQGQLLNINTASSSDMRLRLHISSTTAQKIIDYRQQHGPYTSVEQLLQVVSTSIYNKIKSLVTV